MSETPEDEQWLTTSEVADMLPSKPSYKTAARMAEEGAFPGAVQLRTGGQWRIPLSAVEEYLKALKPRRRKHSA